MLRAIVQRKERLKSKMLKTVSMLLVLAIMLTQIPAVFGGDQTVIAVQNQGFESGNPPTGWTISGGTWGTQYSKSTTQKIDGSYSLKIYDSSSSSGYGMRSANIEANAYSYYSATVAAFAASGKGQLYLEFRDSAGTRISTAIITTTLSGQWELLRAEGMAPAGTKYVSLLIYSYGANIGTCYYDYAQVVRVDDPKLINPGFEGIIDANGEPLGWNVYSGTMGTNLIVSTDRAYDGTKSLKLVDNSSSAGYGLRSEPTGALPGNKYRAEAWVYSTTGASQLLLEFWQGTTRLKVVTATCTTTGTWEKISTPSDSNAVAPTGTEFITVMVNSGSTNVSTSYFDKISAFQYLDPPATSFTPQVTTHPRLFFTQSDINTLKSKKTDSTVNKYGIKFSDVWSDILNKADVYLAETSITNSLPTYGISITYQLPLTRPEPRENPPTYTGSRYPYWTWLGSAMQTRIETLSYVYKMTDDIRYGNKAKEYALALAAWDTWCDPTYANNLGSLDNAAITRGVASAYDMCYDLLSQSECSDLLTAMYEKGIRPLYKAIDAKVDNNLYMTCANSLGAAAAVALGEMPSYDAYLYKAYDYWMWYLDTKNSSNNTEGFNYTSVSLNGLYETADFVNRITGVNNPFTHSYTGKISRWLVDFLAPDGMGLADFSDSGRAIYFGSPMAILSSKGDGLAGWYIKESRWAKNGGIFAFNYLSSTGALTTPIQAGLPSTSIANANIGFASIKTGWGSNDHMLAMYSGPSGLGHNHQDDNSFVYNVAGEWLLVDPGYFNASSTAKQTVTQQSIGHNTMLINGSGQSNKTGGSIAGSFVSPAIDLLVGDATDSYVTTPNVSSWKRRIFSVKSDYVIVNDYVSLSASGTPQILLHGDNASTFTSGGSALVPGTTLPANFTIEKQRASVAVQSLRPTAATRGYGDYTGAEMFGTYGSIKPSSAVTSESFVTLLRPSVHKQGVIEGESMLPAAASGGGPNSQGLNSNLGHYLAYYGGTGGAGDFVTYNFNVASAGQYNFKVGLFKYTSGGVVTIKLDGATLQSGVNTYGDPDLYELTFNNKTLSQGTHSITFEITGKDADSFGYNVALDYIRLLGTSESVQTAQPYTVNTATSGTATGLVITLDASTTDQFFINPAGTSTYTTGNLTLTAKGYQGMMRKTSSGAYLNYSIIATQTTGVNLTDGTQTLVQDLGTSSSIGMDLDASGKWLGALRMGAAGSPKMYVPSVTQVKLNGAVLSGSQYSYSGTTKLITINNVGAGDHIIEVTP